MFKNELAEMYAYLKRNYFELVVISSGILFLLLATFHLVGTVWQNHLLFYFLLPILTIIFVLRRNPIPTLLK